MVSPQIKKVITDFTTRWPRTILTLAGLVICQVALIAIASSFVILSDDLTENYTQTNPHSVEGIVGPLTSEQVEQIANIPGVDEVEERRRVPVRIEIRDGQWFTGLLFVVEDFDSIRIDQFTSESGTWSPQDGEVLIERDGRFFLQAAFGSDLNIRLPNGVQTQLNYVGQAHDPGQAPSRMERAIYGYVTRATYNSWDLPNPTSRLLITVEDPDAAQETGEPAGPHGPAPTESRAEYVANHLVPVMEYWDVDFVSATLNDTTEHPHAFQMRSIMALLAGLLVTALVLCGALSINLIDSILTAEVRNMGVMKALGGRRRQILSGYLLGMAVLAGLSALIGLGFALDLGRDLAEFVARMLNFELLSERYPAWLPVAMVGFGLLIPLSLTAWRVTRVTATPVREALQNDTHIATGKSQHHIARLTSWMPMLPRTALRNLFRSPRRTLLTVTLVVVGLVAFLMAANIRSSLLDTVDAVQRSQRSNVIAYIREPAPVAALDERLSGYSEIENSEFWNIRQSRLFQVGENVGRSQIVSFVPPDTDMLVPDMMRGAWLDEDRPTGIVVSNMIYLESDDVDIGSVFDLEVDGERTSVTVVGVIKEFGGGAVYAPAGLAEELGISSETANAILVRLRNRSPQTQARFSRQLESDLVADGYNVSQARTTTDIELIVEGHLDVIALVLEVVAAVMLIVAVLGLASATSVNVIERTRETGVLKAIGAGSGAVRRLFVWESAFIVLIAWVLALLIAPIPSKLVSTSFGLVIVQYPFNYEPALWAIPAAGLFGLAIAILASWMPAHMATRKSVRAAVQSV